MRLVTFESECELFALPPISVRSVMRAQRAAPIPGVPDCVLGMVDVHGQLVPAVDAQLLLGGRAVEATAESCLIVIKLDGRDVALLVQRLGPSLLLAPDRIDSTPKIGGRSAAPWVRNVARVADGVCMVLDPGMLLEQHLHAMDSCMRSAAEETGRDSNHDTQTRCLAA